MSQNKFELLNQPEKKKRSKLKCLIAGTALFMIGAFSGCGSEDSSAQAPTDTIEQTTTPEADSQYEFAADKAIAEMPNVEDLQIKTDNKTVEELAREILEKIDYSADYYENDESVNTLIANDIWSYKDTGGYINGEPFGEISPFILKYCPGQTAKDASNFYGQYLAEPLSQRTMQALFGEDYLNNAAVSDVAQKFILSNKSELGFYFMSRLGQENQAFDQKHTIDAFLVATENKIEIEVFEDRNTEDTNLADKLIEEGANLVDSRGKFEISYEIIKNINNENVLKITSMDIIQN